MNYTEKYHLPQWKKEDRVMMEDFNAAMSSLEEGLLANKAEAEAGIAEAKSAATEAAKLPYVIGTYTGNGASVRNIDIGFQASCIIAWGDQRAIVSHGGEAFMVAGRNQPSSRIRITSTGFQIDMSDTQDPIPRMNKNNTLYEFIAFR